MGFSGNKGGKGRNVRELPHAERTHVESGCHVRSGKTTVIVRKANLLNPPKPKEKGEGKKGRGGKERSERGDQGNGE